MQTETQEPFYEPLEGCDWVHKTNVCGVCKEVMPNGKVGFSPFVACDPCSRKISLQAKQIAKEAREDADKLIADLNKELKIKVQKATGTEEEKSTFDFSSFLLGVSITGLVILIGYLFF